MFYPVKGGSSLIVGEDDLAVEVFLPPVGYVWNYETSSLESTEIICRSTIQDEQYWERPARPENYAKKSAREKLLRKNDPEYIDHELQEYREREWHRRLYGAWFLNDGEYTYLPGDYYFYLAHWNIDIGAPSFKIADLKKSYFWNYCQQDPVCYGMLEMTKRRVGKTYFATAMNYEFCSRVPNAHGGIQSKTGQDAGKVFGEKLIQPWRKLIDFFRPEYDTSKGDVPKTELRFFKTARKGSSIGEEEYDAGGELESWIDFTNSGTHAYDSQKMRRYMCDEVFKTIEADIIKRHGVVKPCLENESGEVIGKAIYTSTVEDMDGYMDLYLKLWNQSDFTKKNENGKTISGLYRYFTAAQDIMFVDKFGRPDRERALTKIQNEIDAMTDPRDIAEYIRKNPRNWKEAFRTSGSDCIYNPLKLDDRLAVLNFKKESDLFKRYNLVWDEDVDKNAIPKVRLVESANGRFMFAWNFANPDEANDVQRRGKSFFPKNILRFIIGIDPFDHDRTKSGTFSKGAAAAYMKFDPLDKDMSENFIVAYASRPPTAAIFYEDMVKLCHYLSCQMLFEDQKIGIKTYFEERGYGAFMMKDAAGNVGISASGKSHQSLAEHTEVFIEDNCHKVMFADMITDWKNFDLDDTTKFDLAMASGYALIGAAKLKRKSGLLSKLNSTKSRTYVRKFKIKKNGSSRTSKFSKPLY
jgi:hypothetical protein